MASLKDIRKRIASVKNTQKITRAMKMVSAAKLRRAHQAVVAARPYGEGIKRLIAELARDPELANEPIMVQNPEPKKQVMLVYSSNKGLCGGFNSNLLRKVQTQLHLSRESFEVVDLDLIGRKSRDFFRARQQLFRNFYEGYAETFSIQEASQLATEMMQGFLEGRYDEYWIAYNRFKTALSQEVCIERIFPLHLETDVTQALSMIDCLYEPSKQELLTHLIPQYVATRLYNAHLESLASELGARMTAMESATKNASEVIGKLTLKYNRARQAAITTELMDIVNGANSIS